MKVLVGKSWKEGVLDETLHSETVRIQVQSWFRHRSVTGVFFERTASVSGIVGYLRKVGPRDVIRKVVSRLSERNRNFRFLCTGVGKLSLRDISPHSTKVILFLLLPRYTHKQCLGW